HRAAGAGVSPAMSPIAEVSVIGTTLAPPRLPTRSLRARIQRYPDAARLRTAPDARPVRGPNVWDTHPAAGPPTAVPPTNSSEYSAITRPRMIGGDESCSVEFAVARNNMLVAPTGINMIPSSAVLGMYGAVRKNAPNARPIAIRNFIVGFRRAAASPPAIAPIAMIELSKP